MGEQVRTRYRRLVEVRLLHHYWLDQGATGFDDLPDADRTARLLRYDVRRIVEIIPGVEAGFRATPAGFVVVVPGDTVLDTGTVLEFAVVAVDPELLNYTALGLRRRPVLLSNLTGVTRTLGGRKHLFLSSEYPAAGAAVEDFAVSGGQLRQLTGDQPGAGEQVLGPAADHPVYFHQGEAGVNPAPGLLAVVRLAAIRPGDPDFSLVDLAGRLPAVTPVFEVRLKNRATVRRYRRCTDGTVTVTEPAPTPLTWFGNAGPGRKPGTGGIAVERDSAAPERVARLVSEIFV